jgi:hypothetical protein
MKKKPIKPTKSVPNSCYFFATVQLSLAYYLHLNQAYETLNDLMLGVPLFALFLYLLWVINILELDKDFREKTLPIVIDLLVASITCLILYCFYLEKIILGIMLIFALPMGIALIVLSLGYFKDFIKEDGLQALFSLFFHSTLLLIVSLPGVRRLWESWRDR